MRIHLAFAALALTIGCVDGPTQTTGVPIVPPAPAPPPPPAPPPAPPPSTAPWFGFVGTEAEGFVAISAPAEAIGSYPLAINDASQVVGRVAYSDRVAHAFVWSRADGMKDLGGFPGSAWSEATAINSKGQVAGYGSTPDGRYHAFRWSAENGMVDLGLLPGCVSAWANGINSSGEVVGECLVDPQSARMRPFLWTESRGMEDLGTLSSDNDGGALAINDHRQIAGYSSPYSYYDDEWRAVLWTRVGDGARLDNCPSTGNGCSAWATAINNRGDVAGNAYGTPFMWMPDGRGIGLGVPSGMFGSANAINDARQIVGYTVAYATGSPMSAFVWTEGLVVRALVMPGKTEMIATGINNKGEIVGYSR